MEQRAQEYRYRQPTRQRAALWLVLSTVLAVGLLAVLIAQWAAFDLATRGVAAILLIILLYTIRAQLARLTYRCRILPDRIEVIAALNNRTIPWTNIVEVRRLNLPQFGRKPAWACTIFTRSRHGNPAPTYLFDHQLDQAESALREIVSATPHAQHTNI
ncbi:MAG TPA: hypothetical protein VFZ66_04805 [Herpetosiphonaceae bacterium]